MRNSIDTKMDIVNSLEDSNTIENIESPMFSRKISDAENMEAIKRYIENQEKEIQELENQKNKMLMNKEIKVENHDNSKGPSKSTMDVIQQGGKVVMATNMIDMILKENKGQKATDLKPKSLSSKEKGIIALTVGTKVEVKDFSESWYPANIIEVDYDEMEVLVHYENIANKHDEWISVNSPRLRPFKEIPKSPIITEMDSKEDTQHEKGKSLYVVGERCLARWRDNRRFIATVCSYFGNGNYEVMFDDGAKWKCPIARMYKLKETKSELTVETSMSPTPSTPSPTLIEPGPSSSPNPNITPPVPFHTHLFDPTRDYLGSKSERRAMKRKLNIKEIFNIGQKKQRIKPRVEKVEVEKEKKPKVIKKKVEPKNEDFVKVEVKAEIPDAVASIIGTVDSITNKDDEKLSEKEVETEQAEVLKNIKELPDKTEKEESQHYFKEVNQQEITEVNSNEQNSEEKITVGNKSVENEIPLDIKVNNLEENKECTKGTDRASTIGNVEENTEKNLKENDQLKIEGNQDENLERNVEKNQEENAEDIRDAMSVETDNTEEYEEVRVDPNEELIEESMDSLVNSTVDTDLVAPSDLGFEDSVIEEEISLQNFEKPDDNKQEVLEKMQEVINKLEDGLKVDTPKPELVVKLEKLKLEKEETRRIEKPKKLKKSKKLRLLQEKKVKKQVEKVKSELEEMKKQVEEMRKQMLLKTEELSKARPFEMPESFLLPGEWCCKWVNGEPVGTVSEMEIDKDGKGGLPRRSVQVEDKRLPPGWTKHMVRRSIGQSAGKWDVVVIAPDNRRIHTKTDMRSYLDHLQDDSLQPYEAALTDFGVHLKLARRMGWYQTDQSKVQPIDSNISPLTKTKKFRVRNNKNVKRRKKPKLLEASSYGDEMPGTSGVLMEAEQPMLEDGYVYVGSLKVQIIDTLLRCPAEGCLKNFRNNTLLQMHIKHYHRELRKMLGATPKVLDLARERTKPTDFEPKSRPEPESKIIKVKIPRPPKKTVKEEPKQEIEEAALDVAPPQPISERIPRSQDSPKLRQALANKPVKRPKVLLPVRRPEPEPIPESEDVEPMDFDEMSLDTELPIEPLDFEAEISTHTVTKPFDDYKRREKKRLCISTGLRRPLSEEDDWFGDDDVDTRSSFPGSGTPDSKTTDKPIGPLVSSESNEEPKEANMYMFTETGERIKIEHMKREEIINCHCGFREEDGLMVQCELCLCWQHALCHNIQRESEVPEKYTCSICLNPRRGRRSKRFIHDQDRLYEGLLPGAKPCESLRRSHELSGNLLRIQDALHALRVKYYVATKKNHPKLYLWAKDWENAELNQTQERLNSDYSDLNIIVNNISNENLPMRTGDGDIREPHLDMRTITEDVDDRYAHREGSLLGLTPGLSSPSAASLDLPITTSELERLAKSVQEQAEMRVGGVSAPQPEAAIENSACRERLLRHVQRCQALVDARLDSIEAQVAELESQDPSFEDDETADYFPRTKQTVQMLMRDLDTMEELGIIT